MAKTPVTWEIQDFSVKQGDTFTLPLDWDDENGAMDLTGYTFKFTYKDGVGSEDTVLTSPTDIIVSGNTTVITISSADTEDFSCDLPYTFSYTLASKTTTVLMGVLKFTSKYGA